jgi:predicted small lipoprotein YifL
MVEKAEEGGSVIGALGRLRTGAGQGFACGPPICYVGFDPGAPPVIQHFSRPVRVIPLIGILLIGVGALALAACGRKGPLDPPPSAGLTDPAAPPGPVGPDGRPLPPAPGQRKPLPMDFLLD